MNIDLKAQLSHAVDTTEAATVVDINEHGLFVRSEAPLERGAVERLEVELPDGPLEAYGIVRFVGRKPGGVGLGLELCFDSAAKRQRWVTFYQASVPGALRAA